MSKIDRRDVMAGITIAQNAAIVARQREQVLLQSEIIRQNEAINRKLAKAEYEKECEKKRKHALYLISKIVESDISSRNARDIVSYFYFETLEKKLLELSKDYFSHLEEIADKEYLDKIIMKVNLHRNKIENYVKKDEKLLKTKELINLNIYNFENESCKLNKELNDISNQELTVRENIVNLNRILNEKMKVFEPKKLTCELIKSDIDRLNKIFIGGIRDPNYTSLWLFQRRIIYTFYPAVSLLLLPSFLICVIIIMIHKLIPLSLLSLLFVLIYYRELSNYYNTHEPKEYDSVKVKLESILAGRTEVMITIENYIKDYQKQLISSKNELYSITNNKNIVYENLHLLEEKLSELECQNPGIIEAANINNDKQHYWIDYFSFIPKFQSNRSRAIKNKK